MKKSLIECALNIRKGDTRSTDVVLSAGKRIQKYANLNAFLEVDSGRALIKAKEVNAMSMSILRVCQLHTRMCCVLPTTSHTLPLLHHMTSHRFSD